MAKKAIGWAMLSVAVVAVTASVVASVGAGGAIVVFGGAAILGALVIGGINLVEGAGDADRRAMEPARMERTR